MKTSYREVHIKAFNEQDNKIDFISLLFIFYAAMESYFTVTHQSVNLNIECATVDGLKYDEEIGI